MRVLVTVLGGVAMLGLVISTASGPARALAPSPEAGADLAARWCAGCHVVSRSGAGTDSAPSFAAIATRRGPEEMRAFLARPHAQPMRGFALSTREIEDVVAYIETLEQHARQ